MVLCGGVLIVPLIAVLMIENAVYCEISVYPGLRRKPIQPSVLQQQFDISPDFLAQLMEENARRRLQQQFEQQMELINMQMSRQREREQQHQQRQDQQQQHHHHHHHQHQQHHQHHHRKQYDEDLRHHHPEEKVSDEVMRKPNNSEEDEIVNPLKYDNPNTIFTYKFPNDEVVDDENQEPIPFAVNPSDPRYYAENQPPLDSYEEYEPPEMIKQPEGNKNFDTTTTTFHRIKPHPSAAASSVSSVKPVQNMLPSNGHGRNDISALIEKLQKEGNSETTNLNPLDTARVTDEHVVLRQHMGIEGDMGMYVVALVAGISAAITVGLIALGIAWYTFQNKSKAAADVEYPAYGVTGPNKDISPSSGDRRLAQSAQMYHYQHQKQQIIAMENRQTIEGNCGLSDVESDDDNEEGDYTVYECPGLAPTGEMEVKNPLFLDDTPVTPAAAAAAAAGGGNSATANDASRPSVAKLTQSPQRQSQTGTTRKPQAKTAKSSDENKKKNRK